MNGKITAKLCLASVLLSVTVGITSCGDATSEAITQDTANAADTAVTEAETENERMKIKEEIPDSDFGGYTFRIQTRDADHHTKELIAEGENGETINDAVFRRNTAVEEKLNIKLEAVLEDESNESVPPSALRKAIMAGQTDYCDVALVHMIQAGTLAADGLFYNWYDMPYVDFTKPWWNQNVVKELTIGNALYLANGDMCLSAIDYTWAMLYNKELAANYDMPDIYELVDSGKWTMDTFKSILSTVSTDLNGDGAYDENDLYGYITHDNSAIVNWMFALGQKVTKMGSDNLPVLDLNTERMAGIVDSVFDLLYNGHNTYIVTDAYVEKQNSSHNLVVANMFAEGKAMFAALRILVIEELRSMTANFGIIPFPKYDEAQEGYYTHVDGHAPLICIPNTIQDPEMTGIVLEAMNAESYRTCIPAYYDIVLSEKYSRDTMSVHMLDIILDGRTQNFGYVYEGSTGMQWALTNLMKTKSSDFTSYYSKHEKAALKYYQKIIDAHLDIEN